MVLYILFLLLISALPLSSADTGAAAGRVLDPAGAVPLNVTVSLVVDGAVNPTRRTTTDLTGRFLIDGIAPGVYELKISARGFKPLHIVNLNINAGHPVELRAVLEVGAATDLMEADAESLIESAPQFPLRLVLRELKTSISGNIGKTMIGLLIPLYQFLRQRRRSEIRDKRRMDLRAKVTQLNDFLRADIGTSADSIRVRESAARELGIALKDLAELAEGSEQPDPGSMRRALLLYEPSRMFSWVLHAAFWVAISISVLSALMMTLQPEDDDVNLAPILGLVLICGLLVRSFASMLDWTPPIVLWRPSHLWAGVLLAAAIALLSRVAYVAYDDPGDWEWVFDDIDSRWFMLWIAAAAAIRWLRHIRMDGDGSVAGGSLLRQILLAYRPGTTEAWVSLVILYLGGLFFLYAVVEHPIIARESDGVVRPRGFPASPLCYVLMIIAVRGWAGSISRLSNEAQENKTADQATEATGLLAEPHAGADSGGQRSVDD
jgi:hypothetical protein